MYSASHAPLRNVTRLGALGVLLGAVAVVAPARAETPRDVMTERSGFTFDLRVNTGAASAEFTESDYPVADFDAIAVGAAARFAWFVGHHVLLGAELVGTWHGGVGKLRIHDTSYFNNRGIPESASYGVLAPLGVFVEVYPFDDIGLYASLGGGIGLIDLPLFADGGSGPLSGYSLELGYELSGTAKVGPAPFLRYSRWAGEESPISSEHPDGLVSRELLLGLRWSFWTPEWH